MTAANSSLLVSDMEFAFNEETMRKNGYFVTKTPGGLEYWYKPGHEPNIDDMDQADIEADFFNHYREDIGYD